MGKAPAQLAGLQVQKRAKPLFEIFANNVNIFRNFYVQCLQYLNLSVFRLFDIFDILTQGRKGELKEGFDGDLVVFALDKTQLVRWNRQHGRHNICSYF